MRPHAARAGSVVRIVFAAVIVTGCAAATGARESAMPTCGEWGERMDEGERAELARRSLVELMPERSPDGVEVDTVHAFADLIGVLCRSSPDEPVAAAARRAIVAFDDPGRSPAPDPDPMLPSGRPIAPDETVTVTAGGVPRVEITVGDVAEQDTYFGASGEDVPGSDASYLHLTVTYRALVDGVVYGPGDWQISANGLVIDAAVTVENGPLPVLETGRLDRGDTARGYLILEVPASGEILLTYRDASARATGFAVVLRDAPRPF